MGCCWSILYVAAAVAAVIVAVVHLRIAQLIGRKGGAPIGMAFAPPAQSKRYVEVAREVETYVTEGLAVNPGKKGMTHKESAAMASKMVRTGEFLTVDDLIRSKAERLFEIHRKASRVVEGGLGVRLTVQFNLFGGSVANLGSPRQVEWLRGVMERGELGCFALTECKAGVLSGLIVDTTATWNENGFVLNSPEPIASSRKTWISQGLVARWAVVIARLILPDGTDKGPHAFVVDMETEGIVAEDMASKVDFNSLDNAYIVFKNAQVPLDAMLSAISYVDDAGAYHLNDPNVPFNFVVVAQRLLSGRVCIAGAGLGFLQSVMDSVREYSDGRAIPVGRGKSLPLSQLPVMRDNLAQTSLLSRVFYQYVAELEKQFMTVDQIQGDLVHKIACGKIEAIGFAIDSVQRLKTGVGSLSLFDDGPFGTKTDLLFVFRFAEGDSAVLQQKMVRDAVKAIASPVKQVMELVNASRHLLLDTNGVGCAHAMLSVLLLRLGMRLQGVRGEKMVERWLESHELITRIAKLKALLTIHETVYPAMKGTKELDAFVRSMVNEAVL